MRKLILILVAAAFLALAGSLAFVPAQAETDTYTCTLTGQELPCPNCCPANK